MNFPPSRNWLPINQNKARLIRDVIDYLESFFLAPCEVCFMAEISRLHITWNLVIGS